MNESLLPAKSGVISGLRTLSGRCKDALFSVRIFKLLVRLVIAFTILSVPYWLFFASERYVSNAIVVVQRTDQVSGPRISLPPTIAGLGGASNPNSSDQLWLTQ
ncbi:hypothetical protein [Caballeronia sp. Lep1P3]|uniref:hypothetical protein n=1 Tax=Caballeronia sp. Lep1P3 TaxID=2878150 RepID=UPI001FD5517B|nr:hypothetical protein [Caballeronia sp. Lep1P3]